MFVRSMKRQYAKPEIETVESLFQSVICTSADQNMDFIKDSGYDYVDW